MVFLPYGFVAIALLVRLFRLIVQRGHSVWMGSLPVLALLIFAYATSRAGIGAGFLARLTASSLATAIAATIVYVATDRWLPARGFRRAEHVGSAQGRS